MRLRDSRCILHTLSLAAIQTKEHILNWAGHGAGEGATVCPRRFAVGERDDMNDYGRWKALNFSRKPAGIASTDSKAEGVVSVPCAEGTTLYEVLSPR